MVTYIYNDIQVIKEIAIRNKYEIQKYHTSKDTLQGFAQLKKK